MPQKTKRQHSLTLSSVYKVAVIEWLNTNNNMNVECSGLEREFLRNQLTTLNTLVIDDEFPDLDEDARWYKYRTVDQIDSLLKTLLKANRNGIIRREYTNHGLERGMVGGETSRQGERLRASNATHNPANNAINNAINGPITSKRKAEER